MEWLLIENIKNIHTVNIDLETKEIIRDLYKKLYKEEKKMRDFMEKHIKENSASGKVPSIKIMEDRENVPEDAH